MNHQLQFDVSETLYRIPYAFSHERIISTDLFISFLHSKPFLPISQIELEIQIGIIFYDSKIHYHFIPESVFEKWK